MNIEIMRKHYERTPKETLINVLVASREQVDKLQKRNKELKQEIERLNNIIEQTQKILYIKLMNENKEKIYIQEVIDIIENLKGSDKE